MGCANCKFINYKFNVKRTFKLTIIIDTHNKGTYT